MNEADSEIRTKGSLCTGTGSLDDATPGELAWYSEIEPAPVAALAERLSAPNLGDMTKVNFSNEHHVDLLTSGDPCQSMSIAGGKNASKDDRFLWPHVIDTIRKVKPREIFLENVQNIVSVALVKGADGPEGERGSVLKLRLDDLRAAGYAVKWMVLGACAVGAPHHRHRWFLRARFVGENAPVAERVMVKCGAPRGGARVLLPTTRARDWKGGSTSVRPIDGGPDLPTAVSLLPTPTAADGSGGAGKSANGHDGYNLRTAVTLLPNPGAYDGSRGEPQDAEKRRAGGRSVNLQDAVHGLLPTPTTRDTKRRNQRDDETCLPGAVHALLPTPTASSYGNNQGGAAGRVGPIRHSLDSMARMDLLPIGRAEHFGKFAAAVALWEQITGMPVPEPTVPAPRGGRRLNPELSEWMMGYRRGQLTATMDRNAALKAAGNGVVKLQARAAWDLLR